MESQTQYELPIQTNSKGAFFISAIMGGVWIMMIILTIRDIDQIISTDVWPAITLHVFSALTVFIPLSIGILRKEVTLIFKVDEQKNALIYKSHWGNYLTFSKSYPFSEIKGFEVHNVYGNKKGSRHGVTQNQLLALCFQNRRSKYLTNFLDNENSTEYARNLNKFLADNTQINIDFRALSTSPYTPQSQKTFIKIYYGIACIAVIIGIVALIWVLALP